MHGCGSICQGEDVRHSPNVVMMPVSHYNVLSSHDTHHSILNIHYLDTASLLVHGLAQIVGVLGYILLTSVHLKSRKNTLCIQIKNLFLTRILSEPVPMR